MTTKQQIRAEIERQMKYYDEKEQKAWDGSERGNEDALWYQGHRKMCAKLLSFLDTLPDEAVTDCNDLEEAAETKYPTRWKKYPNDGIVRSEEYFDLNAEERDAFKAGAEWMAKQLPLPEDSVAFQKGVKEGRRLEREDMLKDAFVDNYVVHDGRIELEGDPLPSLDPILILPYPQFKPGDKVKIIIVKEGEQ